MKNKLRNLFDTNTTRGKIARTVLFFVCLFVACVLVYILLRSTGWWDKVNSMDKIRDLVQSGGAYSVLIFIILQILQTTILQIPAMFITIVGALIFGRWEAFLMSYIAIMIGSVIMFWIGRKVGRKFLYWMVGETTAEYWINKMTNGKYLFFLMMLFPMFPDDILCVVAGLTTMSFGFFFWTNILARGLGTLCTVYFGSGAIIPFKGWGLLVWAIIVLVMASLFYFSVKYKEQIDKFINKLFKKNKLKDVDANKTNETKSSNCNVANVENNANNECVNLDQNHLSDNAITDKTDTN